MNISGSDKWKPGDVVQYGCCLYEIVEIEQVGGGDYDHIKMRLVQEHEDFPDWKLGDIDETFTGRCSFVMTKEQWAEKHALIHHKEIA